MENYAVYTSYTGFDQLLEKTKEIFPGSRPVVREIKGFKSIEIRSRSSFFTGSRLLKINYRQKKDLGGEIVCPECDFTRQLLGMYHYVEKLTADNEEVKNFLLKKIESINSEIVFIGEPKMNNDHRSFFTRMVHDLDSLVFVPPKMWLSKSDVQHFLDKSLNLLIDFDGRTGVWKRTYDRDLR